MADLRVKVLAETENTHCLLCGPIEETEDQDFIKNLDIFRVILDSERQQQRKPKTHCCFSGLRERAEDLDFSKDLDIFRDIKNLGFK